MLDLILRALFGAALAGAAIWVAKKYLDKAALQDELRTRGCTKGVIKSIIKSDSVTHIKLDAMKDDGEEVEMDVEAEDYDSNQIYEGVVIYT